MLRFGELRRAVDGVSQKMLTVYPTTPPTVEYALTDMGAEVGAHLVALSTWSQANFARIRSARASYDTRELQPVR